jgi:succinylarginine dihydrolase
MREYNFDGLVGPTHQYAGLSQGNLASIAHGGEQGNPRAAALQGLSKMRYVAELGVPQAVLPPQPRPDLAALRRAGFSGSDDMVLRRAAREAPALLRAASSASAMWAANAATVAPSSDTADGRVHLTPANLISMFHRSLEAPVTARVLRAVFADSRHFVVHDALPAADLFSDEGAANHTRLHTSQGSLHLFGWGRAADEPRRPRRFPARQTREASEAVARLHELGARALLWQQHPDGVDGGAFHSDVLCVGSGDFIMLHELAFVDAPALVAALSRALGPELRVSIARAGELALADAVTAYPFNSQLLELPDGTLAVLAPRETEQSGAARRYLERVLAEDNRVASVHYVDVNASMRNGGGPACLRLRVTLDDSERNAVSARVFLDDSLHADLAEWIRRHYRDRVSLEDLADVAFVREVEVALDELSNLLGLGSVYDFQRA